MKGIFPISRWVVAAAFLIPPGLFPVAGVYAQGYGLPRSGQVDVYHPASENDPGDDGTVKAGYPLGERRALSFQDNGNGTVTDRATGLMWQKGDSFSQEFGSRKGKLTWENAFAYVAAMNQDAYAGRRDWRVPNIKELASLTNAGIWAPAGYNIFSLQGSEYWSSTSLEIQKVQRVYLLYFLEGHIQYVSLETQPAHYVKAVRSHLPTSGSQGFPRTGQTAFFHQSSGYDLGDDGANPSGYPRTGPAYVDNENETVTQVATGLVWQQKDSDSQAFGGYSGGLTWEEAFAYISVMNATGFAGYDDWRLPNYVELVSLLDFGYFWPIIDPLFEDYTRKDYYWSSTTRWGEIPAIQAWSVYWAPGWRLPRDKDSPSYVRAVRSGPVWVATPSPVAPSPTPHPVYGVPKTGQTQVFYPAGAHNLGDDGARQVGYPVTGSRYQDNGDGTVTDRGTGLMWEKYDSGTKRTWEGAFLRVASLNQQEFAEYRDWRLPNVRELYSLVDLGRSYPAISPLFTTVKTDGGYWGSTTYADLINGRTCYQVDFNEGLAGWINMENPAEDSGYVRAVRSLLPEAGTWGFPRTGQTNIIHYPCGCDLGDDGAVQAGYPAGQGQRFADNGDGTVTDRASRLIWQKTDSAQLPVGEYSGRLTWEEAFEYVREMNIRKVCGYDQWRLPNYQELSSLFDYSHFWPAVAPVFQGFTVAEDHWTSTSRHRNPSIDHWAFNFTTGGALFRQSTEKSFVKAVMGGPGQFVGPRQTTPTPGSGPTPAWGPTPPPGPPPPPVDHPYYGLPKTGQTSVYHQAGSCDEGDDGVTRIGYPASGNRWEVTGDGTVIDWATGLMWQRSCSYGETFGGLKDMMAWETAFEYVARMNHIAYGGYSDWRLPNCLELLSTRDLEKSFSFPEVFLDTVYDPYWSSTCTGAGGAPQAFRLNYSYGQLLSAGITATNLGAVRACRSFYNGISPIGFPGTGRTEVIHPPGWFDLGDDGANRAGFPRDCGPRFVDNGDGTVTDLATRLTWQQKDSQTQSFGGYSGALAWESAFAYVQALNQQGFAGYSDWRLPNQMELYSIVDLGNYAPAVDPVFAGTQNGLYWSSTSMTQDAETKAWTVSFLGGGGDLFPKTQNYFVRSVRGDPVIPGVRPSPTPDTGALVYDSGDYNGDGTSDISIFRPSSGLWAVRGITRVYFGCGDDIPVPGDYNGDGTSEVGVFRPATGLWAIRGGARVYFGSAADVPVPGDYNGDGHTDPGIWRANSGLWAIRGVTRAYFGGSGDQPVPGSYLTAGHRTAAVFRPATGLWALRGVSRIYFGSASDIPVPGDYDARGTWRAGIFRPATGLWAIRGLTRTYFGAGSDRPVPADYGGRARDEIAIFRDMSGLWAIRGGCRSYFGGSGDIPVSR